jgi:hypothetical protein
VESLPEIPPHPPLLRHQLLLGPVHLTRFYYDGASTSTHSPPLVGLSHDRHAGVQYAHDLPALQLLHHPQS